MRETLNQILADCPSHGHLSHIAHKAFCQNEDHKVIVDLLENFDALTECPDCGASL